MRIYSEWEPSPDDFVFIHQTFPKAKLTYSFRRPGPDGWDAAFAAARETMEAAANEREPTRAAENMDHVQANGELLPLLWSQTSPRIDTLQFVPHLDVVPGRLYVALATVAMTPTGTIGMSHVTHVGLGHQPFEEMFGKATANLATGLNVDGHRDPGRPDKGDLLVLRREGPLASSAVALPDFHRQMSGALGHEQLVVGLPDPDTVLVAGAGSAWADEVRHAVLTSPCPSSELVPCVLGADAAGVRLLAERSTS
jgi:hypothetical protein